MKKSLFLFILTFLPVVTTFGKEEFYIDGLQYYIDELSFLDWKKGAVITGIYKNYHEKNGGKVVIPEQISYQNSIYPVAEIGSYAFCNDSLLTEIIIPNSVKVISVVAFRGCTRLTSVTIPNSVTMIESDAFYGCTRLTSVTIPNSVTSIGENAFYGCYGLTSVTIPNSVTKIENNIFSGCTHLTSVTIPNSVTSIGSFAFEKCYGLTSVTIPNSVTSIGTYAFDDCDGLTNATIGNGVKAINDGTFYSCSNLKSVTIGNSVTWIGEKAFYGCSGLTSVNISDLEAWCKVRFKSADVNPLSFAHHLYLNGKEVKDLVIPSSVTSIEDYAFYGCSGLTSVTIPDCVTKIGSSVFYGCSGLTSVTIPNSVTKIGSSLFQNCCGLTSVTIGKCEFSGSSFIGCTSLETLSINHSPYEGYFKKIGLDACTALKTLIIGDNVGKIEKYSFIDCPQKTNLTIILGKNVRTIENWAFEGLSNLTDITIGAKVKSIGDDAFYDCKNLKSVNISDLAAWCNIEFSVSTVSNPLIRAKHLFLNGEEIKDLVIPESVTSICNRAFEGCTGLSSVTIPNSVKAIGERAFYGCNLRSVTIGSGVQSIGSNAFNTQSNPANTVCWLPVKIPSGYDNVKSKKHLVINNNNKQYTSLGENVFVYPMLDNIFEVDGIRYVPVSTNDRTCDVIDCVYNESSTNTIIPATVKYKSVKLTVNKILPYLSSDNEYIKTLTLDCNADIPEQAFENCKNLTSVTIGSGITAIGTDAFNGCSNLNSVHVSDLKAWCNIDFSNVNANPLAYAQHIYMNGEEIKELTIPEGISSINDFSFSYCKGLTSVTIPNSVTSIGESAFAMCSGLTSVTIPNSVTSMGEYAFSGCSRLSSINILDLETWCNISFGYGANPLAYAHHLYQNGEEIKDLIVPNNVTSIGYGTFMGGAGFTSVTIPNSVTSIGESAFSGCSGLTSVTIPNSVTKIGNYAFADCSAIESLDVDMELDEETFVNSGLDMCENLKTLIIGNSLTSIKSNAFKCLANLTSIVVGNGVTSIEKGAFNGLTNLANITLGNSVTRIEYDFSSCTNLESVNILDLAAWCKIDFDNENSNPLSYAHHLFLSGEEIKDLVIPEGVASINSYAFKGCNELTSVTIPNSVTKIGNGAFADCSGLTIVYITNLEAWCKIDFGDGANPLSYAHHLYLNGVEIKGELTIPEGVACVNGYAFSGCIGLTSVTIPNSVTSIGESAFAYCSGLTSITIPSSVMTVYRGAFDNCTSLKEFIVQFRNSTLYLGDNEHGTSISCFSFTSCPLTRVSIGGDISYGNGESPFSNITTLRKVQVTGSAKKVLSKEFAGCTNLQSIVLGNISEIGNKAFFGCTNISRIVSWATTPPTCANGVLDEIDKWECTLYVPEGCADAYQNADQWDEFFLLTEGMPIVGDVNRDNDVSNEDSKAINEFIMGGIPDDFDEVAADANEDGEINVADIVFINNLIMNKAQ